MRYLSIFALLTLLPSLTAEVYAINDPAKLQETADTLRGIRNVIPI